VSSQSPPVVPSRSKKYGEKCDDDEQCQSVDCHFGHCVGKNNCTRSIGDTCTSNNDCCDSRCDFDVCKPKYLKTIPTDLKNK
jgi:hypothetical protein